jgi:hypothetical protein
MESGRVDVEQQKKQYQHVFRRLSYNVEMLENHSDIVELGQVSIPNYQTMEDRKTARNFLYLLYLR